MIHSWGLVLLFFTLFITTTIQPCEAVTTGCTNITKSGGYLRSVFCPGNIWMNLDLLDFINVTDVTIMNNERFSLIPTNSFSKNSENLAIVMIMNCPNLTSIQANAFSNASALRVVYITDNPRLSSLSSQFLGDNTIQELYLSNNNITILPTANYSSLNTLDVSYNNIVLLSNLKNTYKLETLLASNNKIFAVPFTEELKASRLKYVDFSNNAISSINNSPLFVPVEHLDLHGNAIASLTFNSNMANLTWLDISSNRLSTLFSSVEIAKSPLKYLDAENNSISDVKTTTNVFTVLERLYMETSDATGINGIAAAFPNLTTLGLTFTNQALLTSLPPKLTWLSIVATGYLKINYELSDLGFLKYLHLENLIHINKYFPLGLTTLSLNNVFLAYSDVVVLTQIKMMTSLVTLSLVRIPTSGAAPFTLPVDLLYNSPNLTTITLLSNAMNNLPPGFFYAPNYPPLVAQIDQNSFSFLTAAAYSVYPSNVTNFYVPCDRKCYTCLSNGNCSSCASDSSINGDKCVTATPFIAPVLTTTPLTSTPTPTPPPSVVLLFSSSSEVPINVKVNSTLSSSSFHAPSSTPSSFNILSTQKPSTTLPPLSPPPPIYSSTKIPTITNKAATSTYKTDPNPESASSFPIGAIIGGVFGFCILIIIAIALLLYRRRSQRRRHHSNKVIEPNTIGMMDLNVNQLANGNPSNSEVLYEATRPYRSSLSEVRNPSFDYSTLKRDRKTPTEYAGVKTLGSIGESEYSQPNAIKPNDEETDGSDGYESYKNLNYAYLYFDKPNARSNDLRSNIQFGQQLGEGQFGTVVRGTIPYNCVPKERRDFFAPAPRIDVAVKLLKGNADRKAKINFVMEALMTAGFEHKNIVRILGILVDRQPLMIVLEFVPHGDLHSLISKSKAYNIVWNQVEFLVVLSHIASGMAYLEQLRFVHRDLALRNCLVGDGMIVKIADFGLSRQLAEESNYYRMKEAGLLPICWLAPESLGFMSFTSMSDVWTFGITCWELYTYGMVPYGNVPYREILPMLERGDRLDPPMDCPTPVWEQMLACWKWEAKERPNFQQLSEFFQKAVVSRSVKFSVRDIPTILKKAEAEVTHV